MQLLQPGCHDKICEHIKFVAYLAELHYYLAIKAAKLGFKCAEIPVSRVYPNSGRVPTKLSPLKGNFDILRKLFGAALGRYDQK